MKQYVDVITLVAADGRLRPVILCWQGRRFRVERVLSVRELYARDGGCGVRYLCQIQGKPHSLWWERDRWFVQKDPDKV